MIIPRDLNQLDNTLQNCKTFFKDEEQSLKCYEESLYSEERVIPSAPLSEHSILEQHIWIGSNSPMSTTSLNSAMSEMEETEPQAPTISKTNPGKS